MADGGRPKGLCAPRARIRAAVSGGVRRLAHLIRGVGQLRREWSYLLAKPILYSGILALIVSLLVVVEGYRRDRQNLKAEMDKIEARSSVIGRQIGAFDYAAVEDSLALLLSDPFVLSVKLVDRWGYSIVKDTDASPEVLARAHVISRGIYDAADSQKLADLTILTPAPPLSALLLQGFGLGLISFALFFALSLTLILRFTISYIVNPLSKLRDAIEETVKTGQPSRTQLDQTSHIGRFAVSFNQMQSRLTDVQGEILEKNRRLNTLSTLNMQHVRVMENVLRKIGGSVRHYAAGGMIEDYGITELAGLFGHLPQRFQVDPERLLDSLGKLEKHEFATAKIVPPNSRIFSGSIFQIDISLPDKREYSLSAHSLGPGEHFYLCSDVTEIKRIERELLQANKMESLGVLASGISHDFNNLLLVVTATLELTLVDDEMSDKLRGRIETALEACWSGADVIRSILAYSRASDSGAAVCDLSRLATQIMTFVPRSMPRDIRVLTEIQPDLRVVVNRAMLETAILNLINNASDALNGKGTIWLRIHADGRVPPEMVSIIVEDDGPGIDEGLKERIFDPFFTTKEAGKGTGLGLSMVAGMASDAGGRCLCEDRDGGGARFVIQLPAAPKVEAVQAVSASAPVGQVSDGASVLIVEDDPSVEKMVGEALREEGWKVLTATTIAEARAILTSTEIEAPDAILSDVDLPDGSALTFCRDYWPRLPIILMSGKELPETGSDKHYDTFLRKPFAVRSVSRAILGVIAKRAALPG